VGAAPDVVDLLLNLERLEIVKFGLVRLKLGQEAVLRILLRAQQRGVWPLVWRHLIRLRVSKKGRRLTR